jgi:tetratricopeptide (TPR) repeat protein
MIDQRRVSIPGRVVVAAAMALVALAGTGVGVATAQTKGAAEAAAAVAAEAGSRASTVTLEQATAIAMVRVASVDLRVNPSPGIDDYRLALQVLRQAAALDPKNQDILRLAIDAADQAGDAGAAEGLTRELLKIAPDDEPAQLRLISANISRLQSVTARLAAYDNLLGPRGQSLPVAVRSRLAMDAALLHRERGEIEAFASRLSMAASLDSTNREAASLAYTFFAQRSRDASGRLELLVNLLRADPLDPRTHATLARELLEVGAAEPAVRFYANARMLSERRLETVDTALRQEALIALWRSKGPASSASFTAASSCRRVSFKSESSSRIIAAGPLLRHSAISAS